jgi:hypothetical protein
MFRPIILAIAICGAAGPVSQASALWAHHNTPQPPPPRRSPARWLVGMSLIGIALFCSKTRKK